MQAKTKYLRYVKIMTLLLNWEVARMICGQDGGVGFLVRDRVMYK